MKEVDVVSDFGDRVRTCGFFTLLKNIIYKLKKDTYTSLGLKNIRVTGVFGMISTFVSGVYVVCLHIFTYNTTVSYLRHMAPPPHQI